MIPDRPCRRLRFSIAAVALAAMLATPADPCVPKHQPVAVKYHEIFRKACHNCYEKSHAPTFKKALDGTNSAEIDFWDTRDALFGAKPHHWFVRHNPGTLFQSGNDNNCTGDGKGTNDLAACLKDVKEWSDAHPGHQVITVFLDKKQAWGTDRQPSDLDRLIVGIVPQSRIFRPADLKGGAATLRAAAQQGQWPEMVELNGRIIFVLNGGQSSNHNKTQDEYVEKRGGNAVIFVGPDTDELSDITGTPNQFDSATCEWVVFYNIKSGNESWASAIHDRNYVSRVWGADAKPYCSLVDTCTNFIALYDYDGSAACQGFTQGLLAPSASPAVHHHHKRGKDCEHGKWATDDQNGHHHHKRGKDCEHGKWATDDQNG